MEPRELTPDECRDLLLDHIHDMVDYWNRLNYSDEQKLNGLAFSILAALDGCSIYIPAFVVATNPHPDDKAYNQDNGENWWPEEADIGILHEFWHKK